MTVSDNRIREKILRPADPRYVDRPPLPYEEAADRREDRRPSRRQRRTADVIALSRGSR